MRLNVPEDGPIRPKHVAKENVWHICTTNCVGGNIIKHSSMSSVLS
jgi:hypothetical protein